jgi:hypothetical protein
MTSSAQARIDETMARIERVVDERLRHEERALAADNAERETARRQKARADAEERRQIQVTYSDSYASFGTAVPEPADDESPRSYRRRLYNRLARKLPSGHELANVRADDISGQAIVFDNFETMLLKAAEQEGLKPSYDNLPSSGELISRVRTDEDTGAKATHWYGRESFIKELGRPAHKVMRVCDPRTQNILWGAPFDRGR